MKRISTSWHNHRIPSLGGEASAMAPQPLHCAGRIFKTWRHRNVSAWALSDPNERLFQLFSSCCRRRGRSDRCAFHRLLSSAKHVGHATAAQPSKATDRRRRCRPIDVLIRCEAAPENPAEQVQACVNKPFVSSCSQRTSMRCVKALEFEPFANSGSASSFTASASPAILTSLSPSDVVCVSMSVCSRVCLKSL